MVQTSEGATMPVSVWTSTLKRTIQTAEHLPFPKLRWKVALASHALALCLLLSKQCLLVENLCLRLKAACQSCPTMLLVQ